MIFFVNFLFMFLICFNVLGQADCEAKLAKAKDRNKMLGKILDNCNEQQVVQDVSQKSLKIRKKQLTSYEIKIRALEKKLIESEGERERERERMHSLEEERDSLSSISQTLKQNNKILERTIESINDTINVQKENIKDLNFLIGKTENELSITYRKWNRSLIDYDFSKFNEKSLTTKSSNDTFSIRKDSRLTLKIFFDGMVKRFDTNQDSIHLHLQIVLQRLDVKLNKENKIILDSGSGYYKKKGFVNYSVKHRFLIGLWRFEVYYKKEKLIRSRIFKVK